MTRLGEEIDTLVEHTAGGRLHSFEPVRAKHRQLVRRRYTKAAGATLVVAAVVVGFQLSNGDAAHKAAPAAVTPSPKPPAAQTAGLPALAGTVWSLDTIGNGPGAEAKGGGMVPTYLHAEFRFSSNTDGVLDIGNATTPVHLAVGTKKDTVRITEGDQNPQSGSDDVQGAEGAATAAMAGDVTFHFQASGTQVVVVQGDGELMHWTRLDPVGPFGRPGDKPWSVRAVTGPAGPVTVDPSLNARLRLTTPYEGAFAVGANTASVAVSAAPGKVRVIPFPFTHKPAKPGELAVTQAIEAFSGQVTATLTGRTLVLTSATGQSLTLVSGE